MRSTSVALLCLAWLTFIGAQPASGQSALRVVSAASYEEGPVAPEAIASCFATGLAPSIETAAGTDLPESLAGASVRVTDRNGAARMARLFFVAPGQINFLVPAGTASGNARVSVLRGGQVVAEGVVEIRAVAPDLFTADATGRGVAAALVTRIRPDGSQSTSLIFECGPAGCPPVPVDLGSPGDFVYLSLFGTGIRGFTSRNIVDASVDAELVEVLGAAAQGQYPGLDQINIVLPRRLVGRGEVEILVCIDDFCSNAPTIWIAGPTPSATPVIEALTPSSANIGATVLGFSISGRNLASVNEIAVPPPYGIRVSNLRATATSVTAQLDIEETAEAGQRMLMVHGPAGGSNLLPFRVVRPGPGVTSVTPAIGRTGEFLSLTVRGFSLLDTERVEFVPAADITVRFFTRAESTVNVSITIGAGAAPGVRKLRLFSARGLIGELDFTIEVSVPRAVTLEPAFGEQGQTIAGFRIRGSGMATSTGIEFSPPTGLTLSSFRADAESVSGQLTIAPNAPPGARQVTVVYPGGRSNALAFDVRPAGPTPRISNLSIDLPTLNATRTMANIRGSFDFVDGDGDIRSGATIRVSGGGCPQTFGGVNLPGQTSGRITFQHTYAVTRQIIGNTTVTVTLTDAAGHTSNSLSVTRGIWYCP